MALNKKNLLLIIGIPVAFALLVRYVFDIKYWGQVFALMSISFIFLVPFGIGALTIYLSPLKWVEGIRYRFFMPWLSIILFLAITLMFGVEGWACWIMILPVFLAAATMGGMMAGRYKIRKSERERTYISVMVLLPFFLSPIEQWIGSKDNVYKAYTYIDLHAPKEKIWQNVTRVKAINKQEDKGWLTHSLGFPRPIRAELDHNGVGGYRKAIFDKGLVFHEQVIDYEDQRRMRFTIKANPYEIPSTTMDEHILIGGRYFDVIDGTYELQKLNDHTYRLRLYSHFKLTTTFNFYASWWAGWIMKDIQNNILQVIKERVE
jgi:hypothetical protein